VRSSRTALVETFGLNPLSGLCGGNLAALQLAIDFFNSDDGPLAPAVDRSQPMNAIFEIIIIDPAWVVVYKTHAQYFLLVMKEPLGATGGLSVNDVSLRNSNANAYSVHRHG
jgi:hypothetical protein